MLRALHRSDDSLEVVWPYPEVEPPRVGTLPDHRQFWARTGEPYRQRKGRITATVRLLKALEERPGTVMDLTKRTGAPYFTVNSLLSRLRKRLIIVATPDGTNQRLIYAFPAPRERTKA